MAYVHGRAVIKVSGRTLHSNSGATLDRGGWTKESVSTDQGYRGRKRSYRPAKIECTVPLAPGDSLDNYDFDDETVTFECDSGQTYVIKGAGVVGESSLSGDGISLTIEGPKAEEII